VLVSLPQDLREAVDVFTFHAPYVGRISMKDLPKEIIDFEPDFSLTDNSEDGLGLVRRLVQESPTWLRPKG
jgi:methylase of polypeptide subunit release factors